MLSSGRGGGGGEPLSVEMLHYGALWMVKRATKLFFQFFRKLTRMVKIPHYWEVHSVKYPTPLQSDFDNICQYKED